MVKLHAFGDSFVLGDQDDFLEELPKNIKPTHNMNYDTRINYLKHNVSFAKLIANHYDLDYENYACRGSGNYPQLDKLWINLTNGNIKQNDIVLFGITTAARDRIQSIYFDKSISHTHGEVLMHRDLLLNGNNNHIFQMDLFYILSILESMSKQFNIKIIKLHLFDNSMDYGNDDLVKYYNFTDYIGNGIKGNTTVNIINDTWGKPSAFCPNHDYDILNGYENYWTRKHHPSIDGHRKIADWLIKNEYFCISKR